MSRANKHMIFAAQKDDLGWIGSFASPGRNVQTVVGRNGRPEIFMTQAEAIAHAGLALCAVLNGSRHPQVFLPKERPTHTRVSGAEADRVFAKFD